MTRPARSATLFAIGVAALQLAWIFALPPFRGVDEFDHAYRAAAVARGEWLPAKSAPTSVHGDFVKVPRSLVEAAHPVCQSYPYTGPDNCVGVADPGSGLVYAASGAARYNPAFYLVVGEPASLFHGAAFVYALRVVASLLCCAFMWLGAFALARTYQTPWIWVAASAALTPMFAYTVSLGAPNGIEMASGFALWATMLALRRPIVPRCTERWLVAGAALSGTVLVTTRLLGPLWLALVLAFTVPLLGKTRVRELMLTQRRWVLGGAACVLAALAAAVAWTKVAAPNSLSAEADLHLGHPVTATLGQVPLWVLQTIGSFPLRNDPAPSVVYLAVLALVGGLLVVCWRAADRRSRLVICLAITSWVAVQYVIAVRTYAQLGPVWQGRYALPFLCGVPLLMVALAEMRLPVAVSRRLLLGVAGLVVVAHGVSAVSVLLHELRVSPLAHSAEWLRLPWPVVGVLMAAGALLCIRPAWEPDNHSWDDAEVETSPTREVAA